MSPLGYDGIIAHVISALDRPLERRPDEIFRRRYAGSGLLGTYLLLRQTTPGIDPLSAGNLLVLASSGIAGHPFVGLARFTVTAKVSAERRHRRSPLRRPVRHCSQREWARRSGSVW